MLRSLQLRSAFGAIALVSLCAFTVASQSGSSLARRLDSTAASGVLERRVGTVAAVVKGNDTLNGFAQAASGRFLTIVNGDTTAVEKFTRTAAQLTGEITQRGGASIKFTAELLPDASVSRFEFTSTQGAQSVATVIVFKGDTAYIEREGQRERRPAAAGSVPIIPVSFATFEQAVLRSAKMGAAVQTLPLFGVAGLRSFEAGVSRPSADSAIVTIGNLPLRFKLDSRGMVASGSSMRGSNPVVVLRAR